MYILHAHVGFFAVDDITCGCWYNVRYSIVEMYYQKNMYFTLMKLVVKKGILHTIFVNKIWYSFYLFPFKILPFWHFIYVFFFLLYMGISRTLYTIVSCKLVLYCAFQDNWIPMYKLICEFLTVLCNIHCTCINCWETCICHCLPWEIGYYQHTMYYIITVLS